MANRRAKATQADKERSGSRSFQRFRYVDLEKLERHGITQFKPEEGTNFIAVIPLNNAAHVDDEELAMWYREVKVHRYVGPNNRTFLCMRHMREHFGDPLSLAKWDEVCACCEKADELSNSGGDSDLIKDLRPETRALFFVVDVSSLKKGCSTEDMVKADLKVQWWDAPTGVKDRIINASYDPREKEPEFDAADPDEGRNIIFERGKGLPYRCEDFKVEDRNPIPDEWLDQVPFEFDDILAIPNYDEARAEVQGMPANRSEPTGSRRGRGEKPQDDDATSDVKDAREQVSEEKPTDEHIENIRSRIANRSNRGRR